MTEPTPDSVYEELWSQHVETDGKLDMDKLKTILFDYGATLHNLRILFGYITNYNITDPQTHIEKVMSSSDQFVADTVDAAIQEVLHTLREEADWAEDQNLTAEQQLKHLNTAIETLYEAGAPDA